jgi:hypothetical protein
MHVREYRESDLAQLRAIHAAQSFEYALPDLSNPLFVTKLVLTRDPAGNADAHPCSGTACCATTKNDEPPAADGAGAGGEIIGAALLRLTAEAYLLLDPRVGSPRERWQWLLALHNATERDAWQRGLEDVHAWLPPPIATKFGKHLTRLGWQRDDSWAPYCKKLVAAE